MADPNAKLKSIYEGVKDLSVRVDRVQFRNRLRHNAQPAQPVPLINAPGHTEPAATDSIGSGRDGAVPAVRISPDAGMSVERPGLDNDFLPPNDGDAGASRKHRIPQLRSGAPAHKGDANTDANTEQFPARGGRARARAGRGRGGRGRASAAEASTASAPRRRKRDAEDERPTSSGNTAVTQLPSQMPRSTPAVDLPDVDGLRLLLESWNYGTLKDDSALKVPSEWLGTATFDALRSWWQFLKTYDDTAARKPFDSWLKLVKHSERCCGQQTTAGNPSRWGKKNANKDWEASEEDKWWACNSCVDSERPCIRIQPAINDQLAVVVVLPRKLKKGEDSTSGNHDYWSWPMKTEAKRRRTAATHGDAGE